MSAIAFLGLGNMGAPMSANLVAAGHIVRGFDPVPAAAAAGAAGGATLFDSAADAVAQADVVITMLPNGELVRRCYADVLPAAQAGALFVDSSTISVNDAREVHSLAESHGVSQLDAPVSGGVKGAVAGSLAFMVGGDESALQRARPVPGRPPRCATTWCWPCNRSRSVKRSCWPRSSGCPHRHCST
jgi:3-hydroxyisobutyrate dehydrogenase